MDDRALIHGVIFYSSLYINVMLLAIGATTGNWSFILLILLTLALTTYIMYIVSHNPDHLKSVGTWTEKIFTAQLEKMRHLF